MCCTVCYYENLHPGHKLIMISDIDVLKKENISLESVKNEFDDISQKIIDLKNKIENEIDKINKLYKKTMDEITKSYL